MTAAATTTLLTIFVTLDKSKTGGIEDKWLSKRPTLQNTSMLPAFSSEAAEVETARLMRSMGRSK